MSFDYNASRWRRLRASVLRREAYLREAGKNERSNLEEDHEL